MSRAEQASHAFEAAVMGLAVCVHTIYVPSRVYKLVHCMSVTKGGFAGCVLGISRWLALGRPQGRHGARGHWGRGPAALWPRALSRRGYARAKQGA